MITKKHFKAIAKVFKKYGVSEIVVEEIAEVFKKLNPNFDLIKFKEASLE